MTTNNSEISMGILLNINDIRPGHVGIPVEFSYQGSGETKTRRNGVLEAVKENIITVKMAEGGYKSFKRSEIDFVFLYT